MTLTGTTDHFGRWELHTAHQSRPILGEKSKFQIYLKFTLSKLQRMFSNNWANIHWIYNIYQNQLFKCTKEGKKFRHDSFSDQWHVWVPKWGESESGRRIVGKVKLTTTNNVKSCKKFNETAQTANFTDFSLIVGPFGCRPYSWFCLLLLLLLQCRPSSGGNPMYHRFTHNNNNNWPRLRAEYPWPRR